MTRTPGTPSYCERAMSATSRAERISAFNGTQLVLRQSPPMLARSTRVALAFTVAAR